ncbi:MAG: RNA polymerase sigma factor [Deltaproteobacteria bacterium]|nr:RNA polymerase sigma factor [Deltaproteobacteria bacterium]
MPPAVDDEVREHLRAGRSEPAMRALMRAYGRVVLGYCRRFADSDAQAQDLRQEVFAQAHRDLHRFEGRSSLRTWLLSIARHRGLDARKAHGRRAARLAVVETAAATRSPLPLDGQLAMRQIIEQCLGELPEPSREAVWLRHATGLHYAEIATVVQASVAALQMRVARSIQALRRCLDTHGAAP